MNYLAHLYFSGDSTHTLLGNFLGDFVKGPLHALAYEPEIVAGIAMHRQLDKQADARISLLLEQGDVDFRYRRYAGIVFDLACDHFLARHWQCFHEEEQEFFSRQCLHILKSHRYRMNQPALNTLERMEKFQWLENYQHLDFIEKVLMGIHKRFNRSNHIDKAYSDLSVNYEALESHCLAFLDELQQTHGLNQKQ